MLRNQPTLSLELALLGMPAVLAEAQRLGVRISVSIVDAGGQLINLAHMAGAPASVRDGLAHRPRMVLFGGGVPVLADGVGAIGVSGATAVQDEQCAQAGVDAILAALQK